MGLADDFGMLIVSLGLVPAFDSWRQGGLARAATIRTLAEKNDADLHGNVPGLH